ncbi:MAG: 2-oxoacid:acceptor oxidoreductase subunit alpha [Candidatus Ranarchaeia archaeon]
MANLRITHPDPESIIKGIHFLQGDVALAEGAIVAGCRFFAGYPITPASEIAETLSVRLPQVGGKFIQMEDEIASMATIIGASYAGLKAMTATSGPGISLMNENIGLAAMTEAPCVIVNVMRCGPSTGQPTRGSQADVMQCRWGSHGDYEIIALCPNSVQEMFDLAIEAFNLAETYRVPTFIITDETIGHLRERVVIPSHEEISLVNRAKPKPGDSEYEPYHPDPDTLVPPMATFGDGFHFLATGLTHDHLGHPDMREATQVYLVTRLCNKIRRARAKISRAETLFCEDAEIILFAYGSVSRTAKAAVKLARKEGLKAGLFRPITIWPFPRPLLQKAVKSANHLLVVEMNMGQLYREAQRAVGLDKTLFYGRPTGEPFRPQELLQVIKKALKSGDTLC